MSTKASIVCGDDFQLYRDAMDERAVYLELDGADFEASAHGVTVAIPVAVWEVIRRYPAVDFHLLDLSEEDLRTRVEAEVDERVAGGSGPRRVAGSLKYGPADSPRDAQIAKGMQWYTKRRQRLAELRKAIEALAHEA